MKWIFLTVLILTTSSYANIISVQTEDLAIIEVDKMLKKEIRNKRIINIELTNGEIIDLKPNESIDFDMIYSKSTGGGQGTGGGRGQDIK